MKTEFVFRKAEMSDLESIMNIIHDGQISISLLGIDQWQDNYPQVEIIKNDILNQNTYVLVNDDKLISTAAVIFTGEPTYNIIYDGQWITDVAHYAVVHRMSVLESRKRKGVAYLMMEYIINMCKNKHCLSIRIDTHEGNIPMRKFIEKCGFLYCGVILLQNGGKRIAFEKVL